MCGCERDMGVMNNWIAIVKMKFIYIIYTICDIKQHRKGTQCYCVIYDNTVHFGY